MLQNQKMIYCMQSVHWFYSWPFFSLSLLVMCTVYTFLSLCYFFSSIFFSQRNALEKRTRNYALRNVNLMLNYAIHTNHTLKHFLIRCVLRKKRSVLFFLFYLLAVPLVVFFFFTLVSFFGCSPLFRLFFDSFQNARGKIVGQAIKIKIAPFYWVFTAVFDYIVRPLSFAHSVSLAVSHFF